MEPTVLYEDDDLVAINKPSGLMTHPDMQTKEGTASDWFLAHYPAAKDVGESQLLPDGTALRRPGVVHRLDRETSGVLVFAKTPESHAFLKNAFKERETNKLYLAIVYGVPKTKEGVIDFPIGRSRRDFRLRSAQPKARGTMRDAITEYRVVSDYDGFSLVEARPRTGRTHQIRVHLKAIHHPIVADELYAPNQEKALGLARLALHAYEIMLPRSDGSILTITAPLPPDMAAAVAQFPGAQYRQA